MQTNIMMHKIQGSQIFIVFIIIVFFFQFNCCQDATAGTDERKSSEEMLSVVSIGVIRNLSSVSGNMMNLCIEMAISDFYSANPNYKTRLRLHPKDVKDVLDVDLAVLELIEHDQVHAILETQGSTDEIFVTELGKKAQVPIISLFATGGSDLYDTSNHFFVKTSVDDAVQTRALAAICQGFGWVEVVILYEDTDLGYRFLSHLSKAFRDVEIGLAHRTAIPASASVSHLGKLLKSLKENQTVKVFLVDVHAPLGFQLFSVAKELGMMSEGHAWIITDKLANFLNSVDSTARVSMEGVVGIRPNIPFSRDLEIFQERWKMNYSMKNLNVYGLRAYDMVIALANSVEKIGPVRISSFGPLLLRELSRSRFRGLGGDFELNPSVFEIFNVVGSGEKRLGFWTPDKGVIRDLSSSSSSLTTIKELRNVMWPGDSVKRPKGWSIPASGILRVGVPCESGAPEFVNISGKVDPVTNETTAKGFAVDIFLHALHLLPSPIRHKCYCFGDTNVIYDEMLQAIPEKYDMVVADVTIWAPRAVYVDFSMPYLESGIILVVKKKPLGMWIFTKPLKWDLWLAILVSCVIMGIVIWILERRSSNPAPVNEPPQMTNYLAPVAVLAFQERNMVSNKCSIFVLVCWVFMALILMQSFTANLSAILTVDQLKFAFTEDYHMGYRGSSFTKKFLVNNLNVDESRLKSYITDKEFDDAMSIGSEKGGIDAIFDETPYMKIFLSRYKSKYKIVGPTYRTNGIGFAFPVGSPLAANFSRAILKVIENGSRDHYERKYFGDDNPTLPVPEGTFPLLTFQEFSGLFIVLASTSVFALICSETTILSRLNSIGAQLFNKCVRPIYTVDADATLSPASPESDIELHLNPSNAASLVADTDMDTNTDEQRSSGRDSDHEEIVEERE